MKGVKATTASALPAAEELSFVLPDEKLMTVGLRNREIEPSREQSPERMLMLNVLKRAFWDLLHPDPVICRDAQAWIASRGAYADNEGDLYSIENCCLELGRDLEKLRLAAKAIISAQNGSTKTGRKFNA